MRWVLAICAAAVIAIGMSPPTHSATFARRPSPPQFFIPQAKAPPGPYVAYLPTPYNANEWRRLLVHVPANEVVDVERVGVFRVDFLRALIAAHEAGL